MIRLAEPSDADAIAALTQRAFAPFTPLIGRPPAPITADFPADIEARRIWITGDGAGTITMHADAADWHISSLAVDPLAQGRGIGRELIGFAEERARLLGCQRATLYTNAVMERALALYPLLGYAVIERAQVDGFDRIYFAKTI